MTIVAHIDPEEVFLVLTCEKHHTISFILLYNTDRIVVHCITQTVLCLAAFWFDCYFFHFQSQVSVYEYQLQSKQNLVLQ